MAICPIVANCNNYERLFDEAMKKVEDPRARALLKELAKEEGEDLR